MAYMLQYSKMNIKELGDSYMKKLFILFISVMVLISSFSVTSLAEASKADASVPVVATVSVEKVSAYPGGTVTVPVKISDNQGLWGMMFNVYFDTSVFEVQEVRNNAEVFAAGDIMIGPSDFSSGYVRVVVTPSNVNSNNINNGTICNIKLKVSKDAQLGEYPFELQHTNAHFCDINGKEVTVNYSSGSVAVKNKVDLQQEKTTTTKKGSIEGEVLARAKDNKLIDDETTKELITEIVTYYETDKNGEDVTDENGEKQIKSEIVEVTETTASVDSSDGDSPSNSQSGLTESSSSVALSPLVIGLIIAGALVLAGVIVLVVVIVKKKKK